MRTDDGVFVINAGPYRHETPLGPLFLEMQMGAATIDLLVEQMKRQQLGPNDIHSASIRDGVVNLELREPLSND